MIKRKLPKHGYIGMIAAKTQKRVDEIIRESYEIPRGAKITKTFMYSDPPHKIYDCEVTVPKKK